MNRPLRLLVVAGEVSGDMLAAPVVAAIRDQVALMECYGIGGERLRAAGVETLYDVQDMAVVGLTEALRRLWFFRRVLADVLAVARARPPDAALLVYPGFNLRLAARLHRRGIRVIYYVCPQVWAWHRSRIPLMARSVNRLIVLFRFETDVFAGTGLRVDFAGHPLVDEVRRTLAEPTATLPWQGRPRVALLPGSRPQEIDRLLPVFRQAARLMEQYQPTVSFLVATPSAAVTALVRRRLAGLGPGPARMEIVEGRTRQVVRQADAALVASGTATLETAMLDCPMVIAYQTTALTYRAARRLIRIRHVGLPNIVAGRTICPEFIQGAAQPEALAGALLPLLEDTPARRRMLAGYEEVRAALGPGDASTRAAGSVMAELGLSLSQIPTDH